MYNCPSFITGYLSLFTTHLCGDTDRKWEAGGCGLDLHQVVDWY